MTPARTTGGQGSDHERSLRQLGVSEVDISRARRQAAPADQAFIPWAWHLDAMRLFGVMRTQWNATAAMTGLIYIGLDYTGLKTVKEELGLTGCGPELFEQLQAIERGALDYLNTRHLPKS